ncbi:MAG: FRG domain-containing protein [Chloroflexi bacterium]|nr:FRG domain-containing protein [Chloroflexota bacterium]
MTIPNPELWDRDWEFFFRSADLMWAKVGNHPKVFLRRSNYYNALGDIAHGCSGIESKRFSTDLEPISNLVAERWCQLFDAWIERPDAFVFEDGFAALFLIRILWANQKVLLRGHYDSRWTLTSSLSRARQKGVEFVAQENKRAERFVRETNILDIVRSAYPKGVPDAHQQAMLQHYGFPTNLIDCTFSYDIALYFAEGAYDYLPAPVPKAKDGAIYAFPTNSIPKSSVIITIHPAIMRPSLQRGAFIFGLSANELPRLEKFKFVFKHQSLPIWNGIGSIHFAAPIGLSKYLFPVSDPLDSIAGSPRETRFSDTPAGIWLSEIINNCLTDLPDEGSSVDFKLLSQMVEGEPRYALLAIEILANELSLNLRGMAVSEATGLDKTWRHLLGLIFIAYSSISQGFAADWMALKMSSQKKVG